MSHHLDCSCHSNNLNHSPVRNAHLDSNRLVVDRGGVASCRRANRRRVGCATNPGNASNRLNDSACPVRTSTCRHQLHLMARVPAAVIQD